jgi:hypothetical protein
VTTRCSCGAEIQVQVDDDYTPLVCEHGRCGLRRGRCCPKTCCADARGDDAADLAQRFVPAPIFPDRELALEGAMQRAWSQSVWRRGGAGRVVLTGS